LNKVEKDIKSRLLADIADGKDALEANLDKFINNKEDSKYYKRRLNRIMEHMQNKCFYEGKPNKVLESADFFQKIELFMDYDSEEYSDDAIYKIIGEVFKSMYINFLLLYMDEEEEYMPLPYIGELRLKDAEHYSEMHKKSIKSFFGSIKLDKTLLKELKKIRAGEKLSIIDDLIEDTAEELKKKAY
jgi:hypothetical protein